MIYDAQGCCLWCFDELTEKAFIIPLWKEGRKCQKFNLKSKPCDQNRYFFTGFFMLYREYKYSSQ